jgi:hypothetical protein
MEFLTLLSMGSQRDVVYLGWPRAPSYMSPNAGRPGGGGGGGLRSLGQWVQLCTWSPNKLWLRSNSIFDLCFYQKDYCYISSTKYADLKHGILLAGFSVSAAGEGHLFCLQPRPQLSTFVANSNSIRSAPNAHYNLQLADDLTELLLQVLKKYVSNRHYNLQQAVIPDNITKQNSRTAGRGAL